MLLRQLIKRQSSLLKSLKRIHQQPTLLHLTESRSTQPSFNSIPPSRRTFTSRNMSSAAESSQPPAPAPQSESSTSEIPKLADGMKDVVPDQSAGAPAAAAAAATATPGPAPMPDGAAAAAGSGKSKGPPEGKDGKKKEKKDKKGGGGGGGGSLELNPPPEFFAERIKIYDEYKAKYDKFVAGECAYRVETSGE